MDVEIGLAEFPYTAARLIGTEPDSKVAEDPRGLYLQGPFALEILGMRSQSVRFGAGSGRAAVRVESDGYILVSVLSTEFAFSGGLTLRPPGQSSPWAKVPRIKLGQRAGSDEAVLRLDGTSLSLVDEPADPQEGRFWYPTRNNGRPDVEWRELGDAPSGPGSSGAGQFLRYGADGLFLECGGPFDPAPLTNRSGVRVNVTGDAILTLNLGTPDGRAANVPLAIRSAQGNAVLILVPTDGALKLPEEEFQATALRATRAAVYAGWMEIDTIVLEDARIEVLDQARTRSSFDLQAPRERLSFHLPLCHLEASTPADRPQFVYRHLDLTSNASLSESLRDRFSGLRIADLPTAQGTAPRLDASLARLIIDDHPAPGAAAAADLPPVIVEAGIEGADIPPSRSGYPERFIVLPKLDNSQDGRPRRLELAAGQASIRLLAPDDGSTALSVDTRLAKRQVALYGPIAALAPVGCAAVHTNGSARFDALSDRTELLLRAADSAPLRLDLSGAGARPSAGPSWVTGFVPVGSDFALKEHAGVGLKIPPAVASFGLDDQRNRLVSEKSPEGEEHLVLLGLDFDLAYQRTKNWFEQQYQELDNWFNKNIIIPLDEEKKNIKVNVISLKDPSGEFVKRNKNAGDLLLIFGSADERLNTFIDTNLRDQDIGEKAFIWPFAPAIGLLLKDARPRQGGPNRPRYADEIARERLKDPNRTTAIMIDWSRSKEKLRPQDFGLEHDFETEASLHPLLWPRASGRQGARLDPSEPMWRGFAYRNMPMLLDFDRQIGEMVGARAQIVAKLIKTIDQGLVLHYGWRDESGPSWNASVILTDRVSLLPSKWDPVLKLELTGFSTTGASGQILDASGGLAITFPKILNDQGQAFIVHAKFGIRFGEKDPMPYVEAKLDANSSFSTVSIPGFAKIHPKRLFTDFKTVQLELDVVPRVELATTLPCLKAGEAIKSRLNFTLGDNPFGALDLLLPSGIETNLFGRWAFALEGMRVEFPQTSNEFHARGRLNLGLAGISVGGVVKAVARGTEFDLDVRPDEISGDVDIGGFSIEGKLLWLDPETWRSDWQQASQGNKKVPSSELVAAGKSREFLGYLKIGGTGGLLSALDAEQKPGADPNSQPFLLALRAGNRGEGPYWVATLGTNRSFPIGTAALDAPILVVANDADFKGLLQGGLADLTRDTISALRPGQGQPIDVWLKEWTPAPGVGGLFALSGRLRFDASFTKPSDGDPLTALMIGRGGLARIDAVLRVLGIGPITLRAAIDIPNQVMSASVSIPTIYYPTKETPEIIVDPGEMGFLIGWGSPKRFALWNGYRPEPRPDPLDFNWDRTTRITVTSMPGYINTVWGGWYLAWQEGSAGYVKLGYALRAGWVQEKTGGIEGVAEGSASITAALGGVIDLKLYGERLEPDARWVLVSDALQLPEAGGTGTPQPNPDAMLQVDAQAALHQLAVAMRLPDVDVFGLVAFDVQGELRGKILGCDVATAKLDARFHLAVCGGSGGPAIARMWGYFFAQLSFNLGCGEVDVVKVRLDFVFIGGECPSRTLRPLPPPQGISA